ncbi:MAG: hypothetical protein ABSF26_01585 [Thermoguttaceae bacterium]
MLCRGILSIIPGRESPRARGALAAVVSSGCACGVPRQWDKDRPAGKDASLLKPQWQRPAYGGRAVWWLRAGAGSARLLLLLFAAPALAQVDLTPADQAQPIAVSAEAGNRWQQGAYEVWLLRNCHIVQGADLAQAREAVLWIDYATTASPQPSKVIAYLEGDVVLRTGQQGTIARLADQKWFGRFYTLRSVQVSCGMVAGRPDVLPGIYQRGMEQRAPAVPDALRQTQIERAQFQQPPASPGPSNLLQPNPGPGSAGAASAGPGSAAAGNSGPVNAARTGPAKPGQGPALPQNLPQSPPPIVPTLPPGMRRVRLFPRGDVPLELQWRSDPQTNQWTIVFEQGVNLLVDGLSAKGIPGASSVDVVADRMVLWTTSRHEPDLTGQVPQDQRTPLEVYMEGNVVFRQGDRTIYAERMYYDVRSEVGTVLGAEMLLPVRKYQGLLRLHAEVLQQVSRDRFVAQDAFFTSSRLGVPRYRIQMGQATLEDIQTPAADPVSGAPLLDPATGQPLVLHDRWATGTNDLLYVEDVPVFYWPYMAADLEDSSFFVRRVAWKQDNVFGTQFSADLNAYQLLGLHHPPAGTDWDLSLNYMSLRGMGYGTTYLYHRDDFFGLPGKTAGLLEFWGIQDHGVDILGSNRPAVQPYVDYRYRLLFQHREQLSADWQITAEAGSISDRNFLQEYLKQEWDEFKDESTDVEIKRLRDDSSLSFFAGARLDPFFTETQWLPRADHYLLGEALVDNRLTWMEHTSLGYGQFQTASLPEKMLGDQAVSHLPWEPGNVQGGRLITRHELDLPVQLGPVRVAPFLLGELGYWGEDLNGQPLTRAYYDAGLRATLPMWSVDPTVESSLWNVHGLAHKVEFDLEYSHSQANQHVNQLPLYDPLDDNQIEDFRRRFVVNTFELPVVLPPSTMGPPWRFDERQYALRSGLGDWVTSPSMEIADDLDALRLGVHQRWQTKRGPPEGQHILDWIQLDTDVTLFPDPGRDNFGSVAGLANYDFTWHVGDRLTLLSEGMFDFFSQGQRFVNVGAFLTRPPRGSLYVGFRVLEGPMSSEVLSCSYNYWMSPKWISAVGLSSDFGNTKSFGESLRLTRVGESMLISGDFSYDPVRNTVSTNLFVEPRFLPKNKLGQLPGGPVPPAGAFGVE